MRRITLTRPDDMHVHLREGTMLQAVVKHTAAQFARALVMPNTEEPILTADAALDYYIRIKEVSPAHFTPLMTIKITDKTTPQLIEQCDSTCVVAGKVYPEGVTTNSEDGVRVVGDLYPVFEAMEKIGMVLCLHGEVPADPDDPNDWVLDRELKFLARFRDIVRTFPKLRVVLEHITTEAAVETVYSLPDNAAATITVHHLLLTHNDLVGGTLKPHYFCKPLAKRPSDRRALLGAATSGNPKFFLGTDSAPHLRGKKECASGCAGVFTAPVAMPLLLALFEEHASSLFALDRLKHFTSVFGARFYGLLQNRDAITLEENSWTVPGEYDGVVPFKAEETLKWRVL
jgi:dihydroorotase